MYAPLHTTLALLACIPKPVRRLRTLSHLTQYFQQALPPENQPDKFALIDIMLAIRWEMSRVVIQSITPTSEVNWLSLPHKTFLLIPSAEKPCDGLWVTVDTTRLYVLTCINGEQGKSLDLPLYSKLRQYLSEFSREPEVLSILKTLYGGMGGVELHTQLVNNPTYDGVRQLV